MNLSEYVKLSRKDRTAHINLATECMFSGNGKTSSKGRAKKNLLKHLEVKDDVKNALQEKIQTCHLCLNCSTSESVCVNPEHLYFGSTLENRQDIDIEVRREACRKANKSQTKEDKSKGGKAAGEIRKNLTPEERSEIIKRANASRTPESRIEAARKRGEKTAQRPPEERSASSSKGWETRRANLRERIN